MKKLFLSALVFGCCCADIGYAMNSNIESEQLTRIYDEEHTRRFLELLDDATLLGSSEKLEELDRLTLDPAVDINRKCSDGSYPIFIAFDIQEEFQIDFCYLFNLTHRDDVDINVQDAYGNTLLHLIFWSGKAGLLPWIMENKKANVYKTNNDGEFAWQMVSMQEYEYSQALRDAIALLKDCPLDRNSCSPEALARRFFKTYTEGYYALSEEVLDVCSITERGYRTNGYDLDYIKSFISEVIKVFKSREKENEICGAFITSGADFNALGSVYKYHIPDFWKFAKMEGKMGYTLTDIAYKENSTLWMNWCLENGIPLSKKSLELAITRDDPVLVQSIFESHKDDDVSIPSILQNSAYEMALSCKKKLYLLKAIQHGNMNDALLWEQLSGLYDDHLEEAIEYAENLRDESSEEKKPLYRNIVQELTNELGKRQLVAE